jgi:chaperonin GroEL
VTNRVRFGLAARQALKRGFDQLADLAQVTLGPVGGVVAVERIASRNSGHEMLTDTGTIVRRIIELPGRFENMGAMLARHMAWRVHEDVGDGAATALVIAQSLIADSVKYVAAGYNAMSLWHGIRALQPHVEARMKALAEPLEDAERIRSLATSIVGNEELGRFIEEIFDVVGPRGFVEVRGAYGFENDREYVEGVYWDAGWVSPYFADKNTGTQATIQRPYILITDYELDSAQDLVPVLQRVRAVEGKSLVVIAANVKESALNLMVSNNAKGTLRMLALKAPRYGEMRAGVLEDMAIACGARFVRKDAGDAIAQVTVEDLGRAQTVVCNRSTFTLIGTMGRPQAIRERIRTLQAAREGSDDKERHKDLDERVGKLLGGTALLHVAGQTKEDREQRKDIAETAVQVVRLGLEGGVVAGGGSAYVSALPALDEVQLNGDAAPAKDMLRRALLAPITCLVRNAGYDPGPVVAQVLDSPAGWGFDVLQGEYVDMLAANIVDPLPTAHAAFRLGVSAAAMALTTDALIHRDPGEGMPNLNP